MMYLVNKNYPDEITSVNPDSDDAFHLYSEGTKITKFGPTVYAFNSKKEAKKFANEVIDEELSRYEKHIERIKKKKDKLSKIK